MADAVIQSAMNRGWEKSRFKFQDGAARRSMWGVLGRFAVRESKLER